MSATISDGSTTITPDLVLSYESTRTGGNKVHQTISGGIAVSLRPASLRAGTLELFFAVEADALAAEELHRASASFTLAYPERPSVAMAYVVAEDGEISRELDEETRDHWIVSVDFQEVLA